ncbi:MAG: aspartate/glutamate racemase family protein [Hyphomicrobiales bacterium]
MKRQRLPQIGILMLESQFPRLRGDIGHPDTFNPRALVKIVTDATPKRVVHENAEGLVGRFIKAAQELQMQGATLITTSCGFLVLHQAKLQNAVDIPVVSSSLLAVPDALRELKLKGLRPAILTISKSSLSAEHLSAARINEDIPINAPKLNGAFCTSILKNQSYMDAAAAREEVIDAAKKMIADHSKIGAIILECTNMPPYANEIALICKVPVLSLTNLLPHCASGLSLKNAVCKTLATG